MAYVTFNDDPISQRFNSSYANICAGDPTKSVLKILDRCFSIFNKSKTDATFCELQNFVYPVDSHQTIDFEVCAGETLSIYNNGLDGIISSTPSGMPLDYPLGTNTEFMLHEGPSNTPVYYIVSNDRVYSRGCILYITYPTSDKNGNDIDQGNLSAIISFTDKNLTETAYPIGDFFAHFCNPSTRNAKNLINKIDVTNPNANFSIKVKGLIVYVKSNNDPADCNC